MDCQDIPTNPGSFSPVLGWGLGLKEVNGRLTTTIARRAYVERKVGLMDLPPGAQVPAFLGNLPTDVVERSPSLPTRHSNEKLVPGMHLVNGRGVPGSLGCLAWCRATKERVLVASWHVLFGQGAGAGDRIFIVRSVRSRPTYRPIGRTRRGILGSILYNGLEFHVDLAIGACTQDLGFGEINAAPPAAASPRGVAWAYPGALVRKNGAGSGATTGIVVDVAYPDVAVIDGRPLPAPRQILVRMAEHTSCFAESGDSGAVLLDGEGRAAGLLWGSNGRGEGIACHLIPALGALDVSLVPPPGMWRSHLCRCLGKAWTDLSAWICGVS
jgi:hypothetical protein